MDLSSKIEVPIRISWEQALNAIETIIVNSDPDAFSMADGERLWSAYAEVSKLILRELLSGNKTVYGVGNTIETPTS